MELKQRLGNNGLARGLTSCARVSDLSLESIAQAFAAAAAEKAAAEKAAKAVAEMAAAEKVVALEYLAPWFEASGLHTADAPQLGCILDLSFLRGVNRHQSTSHF